MKLDIADLQRLATILESKARTADAKAHEHAQAREMEDSEKEHKRAMSGRYFAGVCREAHRMLSARSKRAGFTPPSWEEILEYARGRHPTWPQTDILTWFNHFEACGWRIGQGSGKQMVSWQRAADNGFARWKEKNPEAQKAPAAVNPRDTPDPDGWKEFLKALNRPYKAYRFELEWVRTDFQKSRRK